VHRLPEWSLEWSVGGPFECFGSAWNGQPVGRPGQSEKLLKKVWKKSWPATAARHSVHMSLTAVGETEKVWPGFE